MSGRSLAFRITTLINLFTKRVSVVAFVKKNCHFTSWILRTCCVNCWVLNSFALSFRYFFHTRWGHNNSTGFLRAESDSAEGILSEDLQRCLRRRPAKEGAREPSFHGFDWLYRLYGIGNRFRIKLETIEWSSNRCDQRWRKFEWKSKSSEPIPAGNLHFKEDKLLKCDWDDSSNP